VVARLRSPRLRHGNWIGDVCFSPDGKRIASIAHDLRVWDAETGRLVLTVRRPATQPEGQFERVAFASGGKALVVVGHDKNSRYELWRIDATTGAIGARFDLRVNVRMRPWDPPFQFISRDGARLALGIRDERRLIVFDTATGGHLWAVNLEGEAPRGVAITADGKTLAVSAGGDTVHLFDAAGAPAGVRKKNPTNPTRLVADDEDRLTAWERASGNVRWRSASPDAVAVVTTSEFGRTLVRSDHNGSLFSVDATLPDAGKSAHKPEAEFASMVEATCAAFRPDGKVVAFGTTGGTICLFDPITGTPLAPSANPMNDVEWLRFAPDGKTLYGRSGAWFAWSVATGRERRVTNSGWNPSGCCDYGEPLSPDGRYTARKVLSRIDRIEIRDARTGAVKYTHPGEELGGVGSIDFTPDGRAIVLGDGDTLRVWAVDTGKQLFQLPGPDKNAIPFRAFSSTGRLVVQAGASVHVHDLKAGRKLTEFSAAGLWGGRVAISADGGRVAVVTFTVSRGASSDGREVTVVWDVASGTKLTSVNHYNYDRSKNDAGSSIVALSPDGRTVAVACDGAGIRVWEVASGSERFVFHQEGGITDLAFAPDGRTLAAASTLAPIYLWDLTGDLDGALTWDPDAADTVWNELGSPDGAKAFAAIRRLRANPAAPLALLRARAKGPAVPGPAELKQLFADLGDDDFPTREKATAALAGYGAALETALRAELARTPSAEARVRLQRLVGGLTAQTPARLRLIRAVEAVEGMRAPGAESLLEAWAGGSAGAILAAEAKAARARR
jgi:WD40 repeat protein